MSAHTPGPWRMGSEKGYNVDSIQSAVADRGIAQVYGVPLHTRVDDKCLRAERYSESLANARLIAAAPELLEALLETRSYLRKLHYALDTQGLMEVVDTAIQAAVEEIQKRVAG